MTHRGHRAASGSGRSATPAPRAVTANEIHIPARTRVNVVATTADVIHSFWVPQLNRKIDMIPGRRNRVAALRRQARAATAGSARSSAGSQHAHMAMYVFARAAGATSGAWLRAAGRRGAAAGAAARAGARRVPRATGCASCHTIRGTPAARAGRARPHARRLAARRWPRSRSRTTAAPSPTGCATRSTSSRATACRTSDLAASRRRRAWSAYLRGPEVAVAVIGTPAGRRAASASSASGPSAPGVLGWLTTTDHKRIGLLYLFAVARCSSRAGGVEALLIRTQLIRPDNTPASARRPTTSCSRCTGSR